MERQFRARQAGNDNKPGLYSWDTLVRWLALGGFKPEDKSMATEYTIKLNNSLSGWVLVPVSENAIGALDKLYGLNWSEAKPSDRAFYAGRSIADALAHIRDICRSMGFRVSVCGRKLSPTLRLWETPPPPAAVPETVSVDLKWSAWTQDASIWGEYAPGVWEQMRAAFEGTTGPLTVYTSPRKEIRFGRVTIGKGCADGKFSTEWDDPEELADTLGLTDEDGNWIDGVTPELVAEHGREALNESAEEAFREGLPFNECGDVGLDREFSVRARSFRRLMELVDAEEDELLAVDRAAWKEIEEVFERAKKNR